MEEHEARRVCQVQKELTGADADQHDDHVGGEQLPARFVGRPVVQPALGHDVESGAAEAGDEAHGEPGDGLDEDGVHQHGGRGEGCQCREDAHMADALNEAGHDDGAGEKADEIARHDDAGDGGRKAGHGGTHAEQAALQAAAEHDQAEAEEERPCRAQGDNHNGLSSAGAPALLVTRRLRAVARRRLAGQPGRAEAGALTFPSQALPKICLGG